MVSKAELTKQTNALITLFVKSYGDKHHSDPVINRYKQKWGFQDMIEDIGYDGAQEAMEYFFGMKTPNHDVKTLLNNYERYYKVVKDLEKDKEERLILREQTRKRVEEMESNVNNVSRSN